MSTSVSAGANLVPEAPGTSPGYWCTWGAQGGAASTSKEAAAFGLTGHAGSALVLTERLVFHDPGYAGYAFAPIRKDLFIVYDVGWDVPARANTDNSRWKGMLGSLIVADDKFPSCTGTPVERLTKLNALTRAAGWRGAGLWVHAQPADDLLETNDSRDKRVEAYFRDRLEWSKEAGIRYWKVDYGRFCADPAFRAMLSRLAEEINPGMWIENARNGGPLNDEDCPWDTKNVRHTGRFRAWDDGRILAASVNQAAFSNVFRAYDLSYKLGQTTMLGRIAEILAECSGRPAVKCILNCESEPVIGAVLGCSIGIMLTPGRDGKGELPYVRAIRWQRIAPALAAGATVNRLDPAYLDDTWTFGKGTDWVDWLDGREVKQAAPARVARDLPLPEVRCAGEPPFVVATRFPGGAVAVGALHRTSSARGAYVPRAEVTIDIGDGKSPVGIFGRYKSVVLRTTQALPKDCRIMAQDLAADEAADITGRVKVRGRTVTVPGELVDKIGCATNPAGDLSEPGMVLAIHTPGTRAQGAPE